MPSNSKPIAPRNGVFISYARSDGEEFANALRQRLEKEGIPLWQDRVGMEGGRDWWLQITEALDQVEFMALVITPNALTSDTVRKEWRYARQRGVCVYPIKGTPDLDFDSLPRWMRSAHFYDVDREWQKFVNDLNTRCQQKRVPFMVGDLPDGFVSRPGEFDQLLKFLVNEQPEEPVAITAALRGAGGYGKTTLAKALCHDERVQDAFDDGILWVTLGENPGDLTGRVEDLIVTLGDERPGFTALDAAVNRLKELLADRDILIVIDDVWDRADLNPFMQGGPRCARLITTRNFDTLPVGAERVPVDAMRQDEATALLAAGLHHEDGLRRALMDLASRLGEWPLLLRLVNSALRNRIENDRQSPRDAITWINKALDKRGLAYFDAHNSDARHQAVVKTIGVSLDLLSDKECKRYDELAIFPEDVDIPLATLEKLWARTGGFDEFDTEEFCSRLNRFSLLWSYDANQGRIRLHDVVRKFLIDRVGDKLPSLHAQLLDAHRPTPPSGWAEMPTEEPYFWDYLSHHLVEAGKNEEMLITINDWRYLVAKTFIRKSLAVEADFVAAETISDVDDSLRLLRRNFVNSGHLLNRCEHKDDIQVLLFSRLQHLNELKSLTTDLEKHLKRPYLIPANKLPDLPHPALVRTLSGHETLVNCCAVSADGATIVSASYDETLKVWDGRTGAERFTLIGHAAVVNGCSISGDGTIIVSASDDKTLKVWDGRSGTERFTLRGHAGKVNGCAISEDGTTIVSASDDKTLKVWDGKSGAERFTLSGHEDKVNGCAISADGTTIVSNDKTLKVWDGRNGVESLILKGHQSKVEDCAISADGMTIISATWVGLTVLDGQNGTERFVLKSTELPSSCAVSADGTTIVLGSWFGNLQVWDGRSGAERDKLIGHPDRVTGCAISADGHMIVSASHDGTVKVWGGRSWVGRSIPGSHSDWAGECAVSADGETIVSASIDKTLKVWESRSGAQRFTLTGHTEWVEDCAISADGTMIVSASDDKTLKVWDGRSGKERFTLSGHVDKVNGCAISEDGTTIVSASEDKTLKVWDGKSGAERFTLSGHANRVNGCAISADGTTIVSASNDKTLKVWDARTGAERFTLRGHAEQVNGCVISADGAMIVSISPEHTLMVWDGLSGIERCKLRGHRNLVIGCAVSADGATIISASWDQTLKVWDAKTGVCLSTFYVDGHLNGCACSADGEVIAAGGARGIYFLRLVR